MRYFLFVVMMLGVAGIGGGETSIPLPGIVRPETIAVDGRHIYITELEKIHIYSKKDCRLRRTFGQRGEGPGEFKVHAVSGVRINVQPDYILVKSTGRVSYFTLAGDYIKEMNNVAAGIWVQPLAKRFVGHNRTLKEETMYLTINFFNSKLKKEKEIYRIKHWFDGKHIDPILHGRFRLGRRGNPIFYVRNHKIFIEGEDGDIHVFDRQGRKLFTACHRYERLRVTEDHKKEILTFFKFIQSALLRLENRFRYADYFPVLRFFNVDDTYIYVIPYRKKEAKSAFYLFDMKGKFVKRVLVPLAEENIFEFYPYTVAEGKAYQLVDNAETETWELREYDLLGRDNGL